MDQRLADVEQDGAQRHRLDATGRRHGPRGQTAPQHVHLGLELLDRALVVEEHVGGAGAVVQGQLRLQASAHVRLIHPARDRPRHLCLGQRGHDHDDIAVAVRAHLDQQRIDEHDDVVGVEVRLDPVGDHAPDLRVDDRLEIAQRLAVGEDDRGEPCAVELAVGSHDLIAEPLDHGGQRPVPGADGIARERVGVQIDGAVRGEQAGDGRLAGADPAGQTDQQHGWRASRGGAAAEGGRP